MIEKETVLIVGAGGSKPYGLPLGPELRDEVIRQRGELRHAAERSVGSNVYARFARDLARSGYNSVDAYLEARPKWLNVGKLATAAVLLIFERDSKLLPPNRPKDHWYEALWQRMSAPTWPAFKKNKLTIATFNYDRSLDHYLGLVAANNYTVRYETVVSRLPILHLHGSLGDLPR